jgi:hypothetical protein
MRGKEKTEVWGYKIATSGLRCISLQQHTSHHRIQAIDSNQSHFLPSNHAFLVCMYLASAPM